MTLPLIPVFRFLKEILKLNGNLSSINTEGNFLTFPGIFVITAANQ